MQREHDLIAELDRLDRFFDGEEDGERPIDALRAHGIEIPDDISGLDDEAVHAALWTLIEAMASIGILIDSTDHLSDRDLWQWLVSDALVTETILFSDPYSSWHFSPIGGGSEEDNEIYLRYYADDQLRADWHRKFGDALPAGVPPPFDRDRLLPQAEERVRERRREVLPTAGGARPA